MLFNLFAPTYTELFLYNTRMIIIWHFINRDKAISSESERKILTIERFSSRFIIIFYDKIIVLVHEVVLSWITKIIWFLHIKSNWGFLKAFSFLHCAVRLLKCCGNTCIKSTILRLHYNDKFTNERISWMTLRING